MVQVHLLGMAQGSLLIWNCPKLSIKASTLQELPRSSRNLLHLNDFFPFIFLLQCLVFQLLVVKQNKILAGIKEKIENGYGILMKVIIIIV